jgi:hypothetical protein
MHTLIPYAAAPGPRCRQAAATLQLPNLTKLLQLLSPTATLQGSDADLTPLHERAWAQALGLSGADGLLPWAALDAQRLGLTTLHGLEGWAWISPCHWTAHADHVEMSDPAQLGLTTKEAEALWQAIQPYFSEDGITLFVHALGHTGTRWLAHSKHFKDLPTASLDRAIGHAVGDWAPRLEQALPLQRLQNEMQMLLYTHPVNDARATTKRPSVNSIWISGTGTLSASETGILPNKSSEQCTVRDALRSPALADDAQAWSKAWESLDHMVLGPLLVQLQFGRPVQLTLCGEHRTQTLEHLPLKLWTRVQRRMQPLALHPFLAAL